MTTELFKSLFDHEHELEKCKVLNLQQGDAP